MSDKNPGKGTGPYADKGDEKSQEDRLAALEAWRAEMEGTEEGTEITEESNETIDTSATDTSTGTPV